MERNMCVESGCLGLCCQNIDIEIAKSERTRLFPKAKKIDSITELAARNFSFGCTDRNIIRKENGLPPVFVEPVE